MECRHHAWQDRPREERYWPRQQLLEVLERPLQALPEDHLGHLRPVALRRLEETLPALLHCSRQLVARAAAAVIPGEQEAREGERKQVLLDVEAPGAEAEQRQEVLAAPVALATWWQSPRGTKPCI